MVQVRNASFSKYFGLLPDSNLKDVIDAKNIKELIRKIPNNKKNIVKL